MAFCVSCGADVTNKSFCVQCGKAVAGTSAAAAPAFQPAASTSARKTSPIIWILVGLFGLFLLVGFALTAGGLFLAHKVKQNPALATAKLLTAANPDIEVLSADEGRNTVTFKDKKTGETVTMNFDDIQKGKIVFKGNGQEATIQARGDGQTGTLEINSPQGAVKFGAGGAAKVPAWVPAYPGVDPQTTFSMQGKDGEGGTFQFTTKDPVKNVLSFYEQGLKQAGFKITGNFTGDTATSSGAMLSAEEPDARRTVVVTLGAENGDTSVNVVFGTKK